MRGIKSITIPIIAVGLLAGSAVGVAAQDDAGIEITEVTGRAVQTGEGEGEALTLLLTWTASDERLSGEVTRTVNFNFDPQSGNVIDSHLYELVNDAGSWLGDGNGYTLDAFGDSHNVQSVVLTGRDGYDGLSALVFLETATDAAGAVWDLQGVILPAAMPPVPELPAE